MRSKLEVKSVATPLANSPLVRSPDGRFVAINNANKLRVTPVKIKSTIQAVQYLKKHFRTRKVRNGNKHLILGPNPLGITILKIKDEIEDQNHQTWIKSAI